MDLAVASSVLVFEQFSNVLLQALEIDDDVSPLRFLSPLEAPLLSLGSISGSQQPLLQSRAEKDMRFRHGSLIIHQQISWQSSFACSMHNDLQACLFPFKNETYQNADAVSGVHVS